jgi:CBS domain containing-hemolysin-like protein
VIQAPLWLWATLFLLLACSGFLSSSETALFSLAKLKKSERERAGPQALELAAKPRRLLVSVLFLNLLTNVLFFSFVTRLLEEQRHLRNALMSLAALVLLVVCGEILPKTFALRSPAAVARTNAPLLRIAVVLLGPLHRPLLALLERANGLISIWIPPESVITTEELADALDRGAEEGTLHEAEADLLAGVIALDQVRVRELMTPRVDALFLDVSGEGRAEIVQAACERRLSWLPVIEGNPDRVLGRVRVRDCLVRPERPLRQLLLPVRFVPEVASALDLLRTFRAERIDEVVVVDEYGGTAGYATAEHLFEQVVGDLRHEDEARLPTVVPLGEGRFRVAGGLSIRDFNEAFGQEVVPLEFETVGGLVTALLGRIPRAGDLVVAGSLEMRVADVRKRRVLAVDIGLALPAGGAA